MQFRSIILAIAFAACISAAPSYSDNAYPEGPASGAKDNRYRHPTPTSTPCTTATPKPTSTPCSTSYAKPTYPADAESQNGVRPDSFTRPSCPPPVTVTLPPVVHTQTRTVHQVRTATVTSIATVTATSTVVKPVHHTKTVEKPVHHTVTSTCTKTTTVKEVVTKTKTCTETTTVAVEKTKTVTNVKTVTKEHVVTKTVGALPTHSVKPPPAPAPAYGKVEPYKPPTPAPAYGPVEPYKGDAGAAPANDDKYDASPSNSYLNANGQKDAYGYDQ